MLEPTFREIRVTTHSMPAHSHLRKTRNPLRRMYERSDRKQLQNLEAKREFLPDDEMLQAAIADYTSRLAYKEAANLRPKGKRANTRAKKRYVNDLKERSKTDSLAQLELNIFDTHEAFSQSLRDSGITSPGSNHSERQQMIINNRNSWYGRMMMMNVMQPLKAGVSFGAVLQVVGMGAMLYPLAPEFRTEVGQHRSRISNAVRSAVDGPFGGRKDRKAIRRLAALEELGGDKSGLPSRWRKRIDKMEFVQRGHRLPHSEDSAAMTLIGLTESAYKEMRDPRIIPEKRSVHALEVQQGYQRAVDILMNQVANDGISPAAVTEKMRAMVAFRMQVEPDLGVCFGALSHGQLTPVVNEVFTYSDMQQNPSKYGAFVESISGEPLDMNAYFQPRAFLSLNEHIASTTEAMVGEMKGATNLAELNQMFDHFMIGSLTSRFPEIELEDESLMGRIGIARGLYRAMNEDGLSLQDGRFAYSEALVTSMEKLKELNPELVTSWEAQYGPDWSTDLKEVMKEYSEFGRAEQIRDATHDLRGLGYPDVVAEKAAVLLQDQRDAIDTTVIERIEFTNDFYLEEGYDALSLLRQSLPEDLNKDTILEVSSMYQNVLLAEAKSVSGGTYETYPAPGKEGVYESKFVSQEELILRAAQEWSDVESLSDADSDYPGLDTDHFSTEGRGLIQRGKFLRLMDDILEEKKIPLQMRDQLTAASLTNVLAKLNTQHILGSKKFLGQIYHLNDKNNNEKMFTEILRKSRSGQAATDQGPEVFEKLAATGYERWSNLFDTNFVDLDDLSATKGEREAQKQATLTERAAKAEFITADEMSFDPVSFAEQIAKEAAKQGKGPTDFQLG